MLNNGTWFSFGGDSAQETIDKMVKMFGEKALSCV